MIVDLHAAMKTFLHLASRVIRDFGKRQDAAFEFATDVPEASQ